MSKVNVNTIEPSTGTDITLGASGDTITVPSGATFTQSGTMNASAITAGTMATARLGSGTADATTFLRGDQTYASAGETNQPAFNVFQSSATAVANTTYTQISLDGNTYNPDSKFASNVFTPGVAGQYYLEAKLRFDASGSFNNAQVVIRKNYGVLVRGTNNNASNYATATVSTIIDSNTTDYFDVQVYQDSGGSLNLIANAESNYFLVFRIIT